MRTLILLLFWGSLLSASNLTVCGISDGGAGDADGVVNGSISAQCSFASGLFSGIVSEGAVPLTYQAGVQGIFQGSGSFAITGIYDLPPGIGQFYPYFSGSWPSLNSLTPGAVVAPGARIQFGDATAAPLASSGTPLPAPVAQSVGGGNFNFPVFAGPQAYSITVSWSAGGPGHYFEFSDNGPFGQGRLVLSVSRDPDSPIPEPSMALLTGAVLLTLLARARWHT